jgi:hypothetical protein
METIFDLIDGGKKDGNITVKEMVDALAPTGNLGVGVRNTLRYMTLINEMDSKNLEHQILKDEVINLTEYKRAAAHYGRGKYFDSYKKQGVYKQKLNEPEPTGWDENNPMYDEDTQEIVLSTQGKENRNKAIDFMTTALGAEAEYQKLIPSKSTFEI